MQNSESRYTAHTGSDTSHEIIETLALRPACVSDNNRRNNVHVRYDLSPPSSVRVTDELQRCLCHVMLWGAINRTL